MLNCDITKQAADVKDGGHYDIDEHDGDKPVTSFKVSFERLIDYSSRVLTVKPVPRPDKNEYAH